MTLGTFTNLLNEWEHHAKKEAGKITRQVNYYAEDDLRLRALSEIYAIPVEEIMADLLHQALNEVEEKMPYLPGDKVIRVEEGSPVYEDVGPMARYLEVQHKLRDQEEQQPATA